MAAPALIQLGLISPTPATRAPEDYTLDVLSLGAGVQSTMLLVHAIEQGTPPDAVVFADTGWEPRAVYAALWRSAELCAAHDVPLYVVRNGDLYVDTLTPGRRSASIPYWLVGDDGKAGRMRRQCTGEYKIAPIRRHVRALLERKLGTRSLSGVLVRMTIGISLDEQRRCTPSNVRYIEHAYPLVDMSLTRDDCDVWLRERGWHVPKSACIGCPFRSAEQWQALEPAELDNAIAFDDEIRSGNVTVRGARIRAIPFLHRSRTPLRDAVAIGGPPEGEDGICTFA